VGPRADLGSVRRKKELNPGRPDHVPPVTILIDLPWLSTYSE